MQRLIESLAAFVVERRRTTGLLLFLATIPAALGWMGVRVFRERPAPSWTTADEERAIGEVGRAFPFPGWPTVLVLESEELLRPDRMAAIERMVAALERDDEVETVRWLGDVPAMGGFGSSTPPDEADEAAWETYRDRLLAHPLIVDQFLSPDGRTMLVLFVPSTRSMEALDRIAARAREQLEGTDVRARVTGTIALHAARRSAFKRDHVRVQVTAYVLVLVLALLVFRGPSAMLLSAAGPFLAGFVVLGMQRFLGEPSNELTDVILPVLVVMIGFTDGVHLVVHLRREIAGGAEPREAARSSIRHVGLACLWTSVTTAIGFASLMIAHSEVVQAFGRASAIGVLITFAVVVVAIPLLGTTWLAERIARGSERDLVQRQMPRLLWIPEGVIRHPALVSMTGIVLVVALGAVSFRLRPDDRLAHRVPHGSEAYQAMLRCEEAFGGVQWIGVSIARGDADDAGVWSAITEIERDLTDEKLRGVISIRRMLAVVPGPDGPGRLGLARLVPGRVGRWFWDADDGRALVAARVRDDGIAAYEPVYERLRERFRDLEERTGVRITLSGQPILVGTAVRRVVRDLLDSLLLAGVVIFVVMTIAQGSLRMGLVSIVPNLFPLVVTAAVRVAIGSSLDVASACSFVVCLGIAVDDTIHFVVRYGEERRMGANRDAAIRRTFLTVGGALVMTTIVLVAGFLSVMASSLPTHRLFATMAAATVGAALIGDLVFLPALIAWTERASDDPTDADAVDHRTPSAEDFTEPNAATVE